MKKNTFIFFLESKNEREYEYKANNENRGSPDQN
jgi:hypothetical protein